MKIDVNVIIPTAAELAPKVKAAADACGYEEKGILNSEILFMAACLHAEVPHRIIESGRARGQSTALLATLYPDSEIVSIELEKDTPDDAVATRRLSRFPNVRLLYGDSFKVLPKTAVDGDVVLVDGPKGSLGIELCLRISKAVEPRLVFLHDSHHKQLERLFTETFWPHAIYSDAPAFVSAFQTLDAQCWEQIETAEDRAWQAPFQRHGEAEQSYGPTLACLPPPKKRDARWMLCELNRLRKRYPRWRH